MIFPAKHPQDCWDDLLWSVGSPSLIDRETCERHDVRLFNDVFFPAIQSLPPVPPHHVAGPWSCLLNSPVQRPVGRYFERLVKFFLEHVAGVQLLAHGRQIQHDGRTIGELDFLFEDATGRICHLETAVKFFLQQPGTPVNGSLLPGPNPADNFESKLTRLFEHQLPLSRRFGPDVTHRIVHWTGIIFEPLHTDPARFSKSAAGVSKGHLRGFWLKADQLDRLQQVWNDAEYRMTLRLKPFWLSDIRVARGQMEPAISIADAIDEIKLLFEQTDRPIMASLIRRNNAATEFAAQEVHRIIVVPACWPAQR